MGKTAYVFPGQGSQFVGMGVELCKTYEAADKIFKEADAALGFSLSGLCYEGDPDELTRTENAQPALVTMSIACLEALKSAAGDKFPKADYVAGHSLGEYTALCAAGVMDFATTVKLARRRGELMQEAGTMNPGKMAAVIGMSDEAVAAICEQNGIWPANYNCPGQVAISGDKEGIKAARKQAKAEGAKLVVPLQVSGAFHTPLMEPAAEGLEAAIANITFADPTVPVVGNTMAQEITTAEDVREELNTQLCNCVQWTKTIQHLIGQGVTTFVEIGPGNVLAGLIKRISKDVEIINIDGPEAIQAQL